MMTDAKITITRSATFNAEGRRVSDISIDIEDATSGKMVMRLSMDTNAFAEALTGMGMSPATVKSIVSPKHFAHLGKKLILKHISIDAPNCYDEAGRKEYVYKHPDVVEHLASGWYMQNDGLHKQHRGGWEVIFVRFADEGDPDAD